MTDVLLSIRPEFVKQIEEDKKKFEYRKTIFSKAHVENIFIYSTSPVKKVVGFFKVGRIITDTPQNLWKMSDGMAGIDYEDFNNYFYGKKVGYAIEICETYFFKKPMNLDEIIPEGTPPQSFRYLDPNFELNSSEYDKNQHSVNQLQMPYRND